MGSQDKVAAGASMEVEHGQDCCVVVRLCTVQQLLSGIVLHCVPRWSRGKGPGRNTKRWLYQGFTVNSTEFCFTRFDHGSFIADINTAACAVVIHHQKAAGWCIGEALAGDLELCMVKLNVESSVANQAEENTKGPWHLQGAHL
jgi:hypothetical protein